jgi:hypothetical protein
MSEEKALYKVELINLVEIAKLPQSYIMHRMKTPTIKAAKIGGQKAIEILNKKPGGADVIDQLRKRGKLKGLTPNPGVTIAYSEPTSGDAWSARNAEISGPNVASVMFCCSDGPNGSWESSFNMPALDDMMAMVHVQGGNGTISAAVDGVLVGNYPFSGDDWIVVPVMNLAAGWHYFKIAQESGYFYWLSTEYIRL